jgi:RNA polymerase sigma-70 factor (ECF subfamily)
MSSSRTDEAYDEFVGLYTSHEQRLRAFVRTLVPNWTDADEIVQEVALTAWKKFSDFESGTSFMAWICTIARFKALSYRRKMGRDRLAFRAELIELMAEEGDEEEDKRERELEALSECMSKLPEKHQRWVQLAYTPGMSAKSEAEALGMRPNTFYMKLNRIRANLHGCIQDNLAQSPL